MKRNVLIVIVLILASVLMTRYAFADSGQPDGRWRIVARDLDSHRWVYHDSLTFDACQAQRRAMLVPRPGSRYVKVRLCTPVGFNLTGTEAKAKAVLASIGMRVVRVPSVIRPGCTLPRR